MDGGTLMGSGATNRFSGKGAILKGTYIAALDQGTTSSRCILFDHEGMIVGMAQKEFHQYFPQAGWVEHDPIEILSTQLGVFTEAVVKAGIPPEQIAAIGITNQRETVVVWDRHTGEPVYNAIVWQCRRTAAAIDELKDAGYTQLIREKTGLIPDAYFSATKIHWILENVPGARDRAEKGDLVFGTIDTWLIWNLTGGSVHATDPTNASRTMLYNIHELCWDDKLLKLFDIPASMLPQVLPSSGVFGHTNHVSITGHIPIAGVAGDQQAALFGQRCVTPGSIKNTYGTGGFLLMNTGSTSVTSQSGLLTTIAIGFSAGVQYALEGSVFVSGAAVQWLRDEMGLISDASETCGLARSVPDTGGVYVVPAFTGLGAPYWDQYARGAIYGITRGTTRAHVVRAVLEGMAYQSADVIHTMESDSGLQLSGLKVDGGASSNDFLMQFQADILGTEVIRPVMVQTTALGAAYLAGLAVGYWPSTDEIEANWHIERTFEPSMKPSRREELLAGWQMAVSRTLTHRS
jgi:glycerol kinase